MKNPCDTCIVKAACRTVCKEKGIYINFICKSLENLGPKIYSKNGHRRKHIPLTIQKEAEFFIKKLNKNAEEFKMMMKRNLTH